MKRIGLHKYFFVCAIVLLFSSSKLCRAAEDSYAAQVVGIKGEVEILIPNDSEWFEPFIKEELYSGTVVRTGENSGAVILLNKGGTIKLNELSEFTVFDMGDRHGAIGELIEGELWSILNADEGDLRINTPSAVVAVKGTEFTLHMEDRETTTITVVAGVASFGNEYGHVQVETSHQSTAKYGNPPTPPKVVDTKNWIQWTFDIRAMGSDIEIRFNNESNLLLEKKRVEAENLLAEYDDQEKAIELAETLFDLGDYDLSENWFDYCYDFEPLYPEAIYGYGLVNLVKGNIDVAEIEFQTLVDSSYAYEGDVDGSSGQTISMGYWGLGLVFLRTNNPENALDSFLAAINENPRFELSYVGAAEALIRLGEADEAYDYLDEAFDINPNSFQVLIRMAAVDLSQNRLDTSLDYALKAVDLAPEDAKVHSTLARIRFYRGEYPDARKHADQAVGLDPYNAGGHEVLSRLLMMEGRLKEAVSEALLSLSFDELNPYVHDDLAVAYYLYRKYDEAIRHWKKAIEYNPHLSVAKIHLSHLYNELEKVDTAKEAEKLSREVINEDDNDDGAWSELGRALEMQKKYREAEDAYLEATNINPNETLHLRRLSLFYMTRHKIDKALLYANEAISKQSENPENHYILGRVYEAIENLDGAESAYLSALALNNNFSLARYRLGTVYYKQDKKDSRDSVAEIHTAVVEDPSIISLSEFRGNSHLDTGAGKFNSYYGDLTHTNTRNNYTLNYRMFYSLSSSDGHRSDKGYFNDKRSTFQIGYQQNANSSLHLMGFYYDSSFGVLAPISGSGFDILEDRVYCFDKYDISNKIKVNKNVQLYFRIGKGSSKETAYEFHWADYYYYNTVFSNSYNQYEFRGDILIGNRNKIIFGGHITKSNPDLIENSWFYDFFIIDGWELYTDYISASYDQKDVYIRFNHKLRNNNRAFFEYGNSKHNVAGSQSQVGFGLDYWISNNTLIRYLDKEYYQLNWYPRFRPRDGWTYIRPSDDTFPGNEHRLREICIEKRLENNTFLKFSEYRKKNWQYDPSTDFSTIWVIDMMKGYRAKIEKQITKKTNVFVAVAQGRTKNVKHREGFSGNYVPYTLTKDYNIGLHHFYTSKISLKINANHYGKRYTNAFDNRSFIEGFTITDLQLKYDPKIDRSFLLIVYNIFDKEHEFEENYPEPGRRYEFSLQRWF